LSYLWLLLFIAVAIWGYRAARRATELHRYNSELSAHRAAQDAHNQALQGHNYALQQQVAAVQQQMHYVVAENQELARYRPLVEVDREIYQRRSAIAAAEASAQHQAATIVGNADQQAAAVVADAYRKAQAMAGEALEAKRNVETYRLEAKALKNVVDGYGDQYLVATEILLDGLAESFAHTDAGAKLKEVRQRTRAMIRNNRAAACE
jgi:NADH dehydrogenase/NADH:ubiquinone oxidoreductase subunit G